MDAVYIEKKGVMVTWALPENLVQNSYDQGRSNGGPSPPIYRQFSVEYAKQVGGAAPSQWKGVTTAGPLTSVNLVGSIGLKIG